MRAATRRGWVCPISPSIPRPASRHSLGSCVLLPDPVSPATITHLVVADRLHDLLAPLRDRQRLGVRQPPVDVSMRGRSMRGSVDGSTSTTGKPRSIHSDCNGRIRVGSGRVAMSTCPT